MGRQTARAALSCILVLGCAAAQRPADAQPTYVPIDQVIATVGDAAILHSTLTQTAAGPIRTRELDLGRPLRDVELAGEYGRALQQLIDQHCLAQAAKTLGVLPPSRVEELFQQELRKVEQEQVRTLGSYPAFSRELQKQGKTWPVFEKEQRLEKMYDLTVQMAVWGRLQNQRTLFITPRMMRDFYRENRDQLYVYGPRASLAVVAFLVDSDPADELAKAEQAAAAWRATPTLTSAELAALFPGASARRDEFGIGQGAEQALKPLMTDFALANPAETVSDPVRDGGVIWLMRVLERNPGRNGDFEDAEIQADIRRRLEERVVQSLRVQAIQRSRQRTHIWEAGRR